MNEIGSTIQSLRKKNKLTQTELAALAGLTQSGISMIEQNEYVPPIPRLILIADALGVSVVDLLTPQTIITTHPNVISSDIAIPA